MVDRRRYGLIGRRVDHGDAIDDGFGFAGSHDNAPIAALKQRAAQVGANGILLINAANSGTQSHSGSGIILGGSNAGNVVIGDGQTKIDAFKRAIAIRFSPMLGDAR